MRSVGIKNKFLARLTTFAVHQRNLWVFVLACLLSAVVAHPHTSFAGVFNIPKFTPAKEYAVGVEPEFNFGATSGLGINLRGTLGLSDMNNLHIVLGVGNGPRQFRVGGAFTFDFFPDVDNQPGIGLAIQGMFIQLPTTGSFEITGIPYIHKAFKTDAGIFDPYIALPAGISLYAGQYQPAVTLSFGSMYQVNSHISTVIELGIGLSTVPTYLSGGVLYYF